MTNQGFQAGSGIQEPQLDRLVGTATYQLCTIRAKGDGWYTAGMQ